MDSGTNSRHLFLKLLQNTLISSFLIYFKLTYTLFLFVVLSHTILDNWKIIQWSRSLTEEDKQMDKPNLFLQFLLPRGLNSYNESSRYIFKIPSCYHKDRSLNVSQTVDVWRSWFVWYLKNLVKEKLLQVLESEFLDRNNRTNWITIGF